MDSLHVLVVTEPTFSTGKDLTAPHFTDRETPAQADLPKVIGLEVADPEHERRIVIPHPELHSGPDFY